MNVTIVPFGNAKISYRKVTCQHGEDECTANSYEQCSIAEYPAFAAHYPFIYCLEKHGSSMLHFTSACAKEARLDITRIEACVNHQTRAFALQQEYAALTPSNHTYVPWIVVDGSLSKSDGDRLLQEVCTAYTGPKPAGCPATEKAKRVCPAEW